MSDPAGELRAALEPWIRSDTEVIAAFGVSRVKVYGKFPPANTATPYVVIAGLFVLDDQAECMDNAEVDLQLDVWSHTNPAGYEEAERIAPAVRAAVVRIEDTGDSPAFTLTNFRVVSVQPLSTQYLTDPSDGETVHAVIRVQLAVDRID